MAKPTNHGFYVRDNQHTTEPGAEAQYVSNNFPDETDPEAEVIAQTFRGPDEHKYVIVCTGDNDVQYANTPEEVESIRQGLIEQWHGSGIYPRIIVSKVKKITEVY